MSSRRTVILIGAILIGAIAAALTLQYVNNLEDRAEGDSKPVDVFVASQPIPEGTSIQAAEAAGLVERTTVPQKNLPVDAVDSLDTLGTKVAVVDISVKTPLTNSLFIDPSQALLSNAERIPEGMVAMTISVDQVRGVAGLIVPGDDVNLMVTPEVTNFDELVESNPDKLVPSKAAFTVYQGVRVIFVGNRAAVALAEQANDGEGGGDDENQLVAGGSNLLTLAVPQEAAEVIASFDSAQYYLSLLPPDTTPEPLDPGVSMFDVGNRPPERLFSGAGDVLTPYGPDGFPEED